MAYIMPATAEHVYHGPDMQRTATEHDEGLYSWARSEGVRV